MPTPAAGPTTTHPQKESIKETIISVIIAFAMAFVFRSFVAEAFIIPTGSMAPTLNGAHMRFTSPYTGQDWAVVPWFNIDGNNQAPYPNQSEALRRADSRLTTLTVHDPVTGLVVSDRDARARAGDRIFVLKYLYGIQSPDPYDVVVFKNPTNPDENYIKRLIALPGEQVALVDGDVFVRPAPKGGGGAGVNPWDAPEWKIRRKPDRAQRAVWQAVFDSSLMTESALKEGAVSPWVATGAKAEGASSWYSTTGGEAVIAWDRSKPYIALAPPYSQDVDRLRDITDRYAYNEVPARGAPSPRFFVGDLRLRATVTVRRGLSDVSGLTLSGVIEARGHEFRATVSKGRAVLSMKPVGEAGAGTVLAEASTSALGSANGAPPEGPVSVEFWHSDQRLQLWVGGRLVAEGTYDWLPMERLRHALTESAWEQLNGAAPSRSSNILADPASYHHATVRWETSGAPVELRGVGLDRDLYYRAASYEVQTTNVPGSLIGKPAAATHPSSTMTLGPDQFFVCGDNSPQSLDARLWGYPDPWVADEIDPSPSVVSRRLLMGKAFFVYFPAPVGGSPVSVPDFGRLRPIK